jgi:putative phosphoesterase
MLLGVISDTHSHVEYTQDAVRVLRAQGVEMALHCGDIGAVSIIPVFRDVPAHFVLGNVDWNEEEMRDAIAVARQTYHGRFGRLVVADRRIAFLHGDDEQLLRQTIVEDEVDLVCYGHTHVAEHHFEKGKLVVNPGAVWRSKPPSVAVVDLAKMHAITVPI